MRVTHVTLGTLFNRLPRPDLIQGEGSRPIGSLRTGIGGDQLGSDERADGEVVTVRTVRRLCVADRVSAIHFKKPPPGLHGITSKGMRLS
jgi:hypothetical protein